MDDGSNLSLAEQTHRALVSAARKKVEALKARKLAERSYDRIFLEQEGKNLAEKEAKARTHAAYLALDDAALEAESAAIIGKAHADGLQIRFEEWRTQQSTARAEMTLR